MVSKAVVGHRFPLAALLAATVSVSCWLLLLPTCIAQIYMWIYRPEPKFSRKINILLRGYFFSTQNCSLILFAIWFPSVPAVMAGVEARLGSEGHSCGSTWISTPAKLCECFFHGFIFQCLFANDDFQICQITPVMSKK